MVRRWRLIGHSPTLYNPRIKTPEAESRLPRGERGRGGSGGGVHRARIHTKMGVDVAVGLEYCASSCACSPRAPSPAPDGCEARSWYASCQPPRASDNRAAAGNATVSRSRRVSSERRWTAWGGRRTSNGEPIITVLCGEPRLANCFTVADTCRWRGSVSGELLPLPFLRYRRVKIQGRGR